MMAAAWGFCGGFVGALAALCVLAVVSRKRIVLTTRVLVVRHPDVEWVEPAKPDQVSFAPQTGDFEIRPGPRVKERKLRRRERALRVLAGERE